MKRTDRMMLGLLAWLGWAVALAVSRFQPAPGYMDADYYQAIGLRFVNGDGLTEPFLWNYLDDPAGVPHPANAYWMPLPSLLAAAGMWLAGRADYAAGRLGFLLLAGVLPVLTALTALWLHGRRKLAWVSGMLAAFAGFYAPFLPLTEGFGLYMLWGTLFIWAAGVSHRRRELALGVLVALMHLTRADGVFWLPLALWLAWRQRRWAGVGESLLGYGLLMLPWLVRNVLFFGHLLAPGGGRSLFLRVYNDLFLYPAGQLTWRYWLADGWWPIVRTRLWAAGMNLGTFLAVQGGIIWLPFILWAAWLRRRDVRVQTAALGWGIFFLLFTLVFPLAGARGGFFHGGAALQPFFWALAPLGLDDALRWMARRRGWRLDVSRRWLLALWLGTTVALTGVLLQTRVVQGQWGRAQERYRQVEAWLRENVGDEAPVIVANPPGYWLATGRTALALPGGDVTMILRVADDFGARYLLLEPGAFPAQLDPLFAQNSDDGRFRYLTTIEEARLYAIEDAP